MIPGRNFTYEFIALEDKFEDFRQGVLKDLDDMRAELKLKLKAKPPPSSYDLFAVRGDGVRVSLGNFTEEEIHDIMCKRLGIGVRP